ncbi:hypothetical protein D3C78_1680760 [compost metagenome]
MTYRVSRRRPRRARVKHARAPSTFAADLPARDAATLNILRPSQTRPDTGRHLIHRERLGSRQHTRKALMIVPTLTRLDAECLTLEHPR